MGAVVAEWDEVIQDSDRGGGVRVQVGSVLLGLFLVVGFLALFWVWPYAGVIVSHDDLVSCHFSVNGRLCWWWKGGERGELLIGMIGGGLGEKVGVS